jgi:glycosyltransferase involved in cell wall biosynthesis
MNYVLHFISTSGLYGAERVILNLAVELQKTKYLPIVCVINEKAISISGLEYEAQIRGIKTIGIQVRSKYDIFVLIRVIKLLKVNNIKIIHSHGYKATLLAIIPSLILNIPLIVTCHLWFSRKDFKLQIYHALEAMVMQILPVVVGVSENICEKLRKHGIGRHKIRLIYNGISISDYEKSRNQKYQILRKELNISDEFYVIGSVGRLCIQKAQDQLLIATKIFKELNLKIKCIIAGDGPLLSKLKSLSNELGLQENVCFTGYRKDILDIIEILDVFVLTSIDEGLPMVILEAMAMKKAIITTPVGAIPNIIKDGVNGIIYPTGNIFALTQNIIFLLNNKNIQYNLGAKAYETFLKNFSSTYMTEKYIDIYDYLLYNTRKHFLMDCNF